MAQLEEGDDAFLELAAALDADEDGDDQASPTAPPGASSGVPGGGGGNRLSWAAKAAAAGAAGAIPLGHKPRHAVLLPPGTLPCFSAYAELTGQPAAAAEPSSKVAVFGAGPTAARNGGLGASGAGAGGFSDVGQGTLVERYAGLKARWGAATTAAFAAASAALSDPRRLAHLRTWLGSPGSHYG
jgi:hypothetical protein